MCAPSGSPMPGPSDPGAAPSPSGSGGSAGAPPIDSPTDPGAAGAPPADPGSGGAPPAGPGSGTLFPSPNWEVGTPAEVGLDPTLIERAVAAADAGSSYCLLVIRHGKLVSETYWRGHDATTPQRSWSIAKSYTSALVGIAIERGEILGLGQSVADFIPAWQGTERAAITIGHLLRMDSGLDWDLLKDYLSLTLAADQTVEALKRSAIAPPGAEWTYNNGAVQLFEPIFRAATGMTIEQYAAQHLWSKVGIDAFWAKDASGNATAYASVMASCRDHAKFGYLYLHGGNWAGQQVVPAQYVQESISPQTPLNRAYGYLWWVNEPGPPAIGALMSPIDGGQLVTYAPTNHFAARGFGNQLVAMFPDDDLIVVRFGPDPLSSFDIGALLASQQSSVEDDILTPVLQAPLD